MLFKPIFKIVLRWWWWLKSRLWKFCYISKFEFLALAFVWPINQTRSVHKLVHPDQRTTRIEPNDICTEKPDSITNDIFLLVVVCSAVGNVDQRQTIRETWAKDQEDLEDVKVVFMLGNSVNDSLQSNIVHEAQIKGDIIQESFLDTYANLTIKSLMLLKWFSTSCKGKLIIQIKS